MEEALPFSKLQETFCFWLNHTFCLSDAFNTIHFHSSSNHAFDRNWSWHFFHDLVTIQHLKLHFIFTTFLESFNIRHLLHSFGCNCWFFLHLTMGKRKSDSELVRFSWKRNKKYDFLLLSEVQSRNPFVFKNPKPVWDEIAKTLQENSLKMKVTFRSCRDRVNELLKMHRRNERRSNAA